MVFIKLNLERVVNMACPPSLGETRFCQRPGKLGLKNVFIFMSKGVLLYSKLFQNKFTLGWCENLRQLHKQQLKWLPLYVKRHKKRHVFLHTCKACFQWRKRNTKMLSFYHRTILNSVSSALCCQDFSGRVEKGWG